MILPLARPGLAVTAFFTFLTAWGEVAYASAFIQTDDKFTLAYGLQQFVPQFNPAVGPAHGGLGPHHDPGGLVFFFAQRHLVSGLTAGGTKGMRSTPHVDQVTFEKATRIYPAPKPAVDELDLEIARRRVPRARRSVGLRQVHDACACSPGSRTSTAGASSSATATSPTCAPRTATSRWCSRTTPSTRT